MADARLIAPSQFCGKKWSALYFAVLPLGRTLRAVVREFGWLFVCLLAVLSIGFSCQVRAKSQAWETVIERAIAEQPSLAGVTFEIGWPPVWPKLPNCAEPRAQLATSVKPVGRLYVSLRCDAPRWMGSVQVNVSAKRRYIVASRPLPPGAVLGESDLTSLEGDWASLPEDVLTETEQALGRTISRAIVAGQAIGLNLLRQTAVIKNGERVRVQMVGANFSVGGEAVAVQNGSVGESVRVKMPGGQLVVATVLRAGVVEVRIE